MILNAIFILCVVVGIIGYFMVWRKGLEKKSEEKEREIEKVLQSNGEEKEEDETVAKESQEVKEQVERVNVENKKEDSKEFTITVGGIESKDYVRMINEKYDEQKKVEGQEKEQYRLGVFSDITDYTIFYGETEEQGEDRSEERVEEDEKREDEAGGAGTAVKEEEKKGNPKKREVMRRVEQKLKEDRQRKEEQGKLIFKENYSLERLTA